MHILTAMVQGHGSVSRKTFSEGEVLLGLQMNLPLHPNVCAECSLSGIATQTTLFSLCLLILMHLSFITEKHFLIPRF